MTFYPSCLLYDLFLFEREARNKLAYSKMALSNPTLTLLLSPPLKASLVSAYVLVTLRYLNLKRTIIQVFTYWYNSYHIEPVPQRDNKPK